MSDYLGVPLTDLTPLLVVFATVLGLLVGSFLNVVAYRVPAGLSVVSPGSACPHCQTEIRWFDNVPVISWLLLRGRCRSCAAPISVRYLLVEVATGAVFGALTWWLLGREPGLLPWYLALAAAGVALFLIDLDTKRLPNPIVYSLYPVSVAGFVLAGLASGEWPIVRVLLTMLVWFLAFFLPYVLYPGGMGFGDVKLAPVLGAALGWLGWGPALVGLMGGFILGGVVGIVLMVSTKAGGKTAVPYGPFMLTGALAAVFAGVPLWQTYLRVTGMA